MTKHILLILITIIFTSCINKQKIKVLITALGVVILGMIASGFVPVSLMTDIHGTGTSRQPLNYD